MRYIRENLMGHQEYKNILCRYTLKQNDTKTPEFIFARIKATDFSSCRCPYLNSKALLIAAKMPALYTIKSNYT
jgi:hypothetical protein